FTFGPPLWSKATPASDTAPKPAASPKETAKTETPEPAKTTPAQPTTPDNTKTAADSSKPPVSKEALEKLGVTDTKKGDPKSNPLDKGIDDLFKDIDKK